MTFFEKIKQAEERNNSFVCVGLDPDINKIPKYLLEKERSVLAFNQGIVDATANFVSCYKPQAAYYAGQNIDEQLRLSIEYIHETTEIPVILDVKRGDIGETAQMYAKEVFERYKADAVTVNPYMGFDTLKPFLDYANKGVFILCRTSNPSSGDIQNLKADNLAIYEHVACLARDVWNYNKNVALVVGATYPEELKKLREMCPEIPFLVPGVGAQGGDVEKVVTFGKRNSDGSGLIINSSRGIIYAANDENFAQAAGNEAEKLRNVINSFR